MKKEITKDYFKNKDFKIEIPTIICNVCGSEILDTPINRNYNNKIKGKIYDATPTFTDKDYFLTPAKE